MPDKPTRANALSPDILQPRLDKLAELLPEAFTEGRLDLDRLRDALGDAVDDGPERYGLSWAGKRDALRLLQLPSRATLRPAPDESLDWDATRNLFIEGENLEALKLLLRPYYGRVKMIYIDPPYNTGNDFIYPDDYRDPLGAYLEQTGQVAGQGDEAHRNRITSGRRHSAWLSMMLPRLWLARQLLREDGVIFISIDDNEVHNLRMLMDEVFGEENLVAALVWEKSRKNDARLFSVGHEYVLVYAHSAAGLKAKGVIWREPKPGAEEIWNEYQRLRGLLGNDDTAVEEALGAWFRRLPKAHPSRRLSRYRHIDQWGPWRDRDISWPGGGGPRYDVIHPVTKRRCAVPERGWGFATPEEMKRQIEAGLVVFREDHNDPPFRKAHLRPIPEEVDMDAVGADEPDETEDDEDAPEVGMQVMPSVIYKQAQVAVKYLRALMDGKLFDNPKDHEVLARLVRYVTSKDDLIRDFFAGSCTTAHAVLEVNRDDGGNRQFIMVQFPEATRKQKENGTWAETAAWQAGYATIADIGKERIRRVIARMKENGAGEQGTLDLADRETPEDLGFRVFTLGPSNYRAWAGVDAQDTDDLAERYGAQMELHLDGLVDDWRAEDVIAEVALKEAGFGLEYRQEEIGKALWRVTDGETGREFYLSLAEEVCLEEVEALGLREEALFVCRATALDDTTAGNLQLQCRLRVV